jgi:hypothetical protein
MPYIPIPHKGCRFGFALQDSFGTAKTVATILLPLPEGTDFGPKWTQDFYQSNQGNYELNHYFTSDYIAEGGIKFPWVPGMLTAAEANQLSGTGGTELFRWLFAREAATGTWQGYYATFFMDWGGNYYVIQDVKCTGGNITPDRGAPVYITANARSGAAPVAGTSSNFPAYSPAVWFDGQPYYGDNIYIQKGTMGALEIDNWTKGHSLEWDNMVIDSSDASLVSYQRGPGPYALPNVGRAQWKGGFTRWFVDTYFPGTAVIGFEGSYRLSVVSGASLGRLTFPRIVYTEGHYPNMPGDGVVQNEISFQALGGLGVPGAASFTFSEA